MSVIEWGIVYSRLTTWKENGQRGERAMVATRRTSYGGHRTAVLIMPNNVEITSEYNGSQQIAYMNRRIVYLHLYIYRVVRCRKVSFMHFSRDVLALMHSNVNLLIDLFGGDRAYSEEKKRNGKHG